jgi:hypothetical protein
MLCPAHSSFKFPNERSRYGKHDFKDYPLPSHQFAILDSCINFLVFHTDK